MRPIAEAARPSSPSEGSRGAPSIRIILLRLVIGILAPLMLLVAGYGLWNTQLHRESVDHGLRGTVRALSLSVDREVETVQAALSTLALSPSLQTGNMATFHKQASKTADSLGGWIVVSDPSFQQIINTRRPYGAPLPKAGAADAISRVFSAGQSVVTDLFTGAVMQRPLIAVSVPVFRDDQVIYDLRIGFLPDRFTAVLAAQELPKGWTSLLLDGHSQTIAEAPPADKDGGIRARVEAAVKRTAATDEPGVLEEPSDGDAPTIVIAFQKSALTGWVSVVVAPVSIVESPIRRASLIFAAGAVFSFLLAILAALIIGRRIALPLQTLARRADGIVSGEPVPSEPRSIVEISEVQRALLRAAEVFRRQFEVRLRLEQETRAREHAERTREEIEKRERKMRRLIDSSLIGIVIADEERIREANALFLAMIGYTRHDLNVGAVVWRRIAAPEREWLSPPAIEQLRAGGEIAPLETELIRKDGSRLPALIGATWIESEGTKVAFACFVIDLSPQHQAAAELRRSEERYRGLAEAIASVVWTMAADGSAIEMQQWQELTGQTAGESAGWGWIDALHPDDQERTRAAFSRAIHEQVPIDLEYRIRTRPGRYHWYMVRGVPLRNPDGGVREWVGVCFDIDERKAADARQLVLMAELDHRVRNILATVQSMISLTGNTANSKDEYAALLQGRVAAMARTHGLLSSQSWRGASLMQIVREELASHATTPERLRIEGDPEFILRPKDALDFALVIHELAANAASHGSLSLPHGQLAVTWSIEHAAGGKRLLFQWQESAGPRVAANARSGFGWRLIDNVFSRSTGRQASFDLQPSGLSCTLVMPLPPSGPVAADGEKDATAAESQLKGRFLIVEDEPLIAMDLHRLLSQAGLDISGPTGTLDEALDLVRDQTLTGAILDISIGRDNGYAVADRLLERGLPVAFVTGYATASIPERYRRQPILQKPIDPHVLLATIRAMLIAAERAGGGGQRHP